MKKRILSLMLMLAVVVSTAVVPVTVQAETTLDEAAEMYAEVLDDYAEKTVKEKLGHSYSFALAYIDEDDVPEMLICYDNGRMTYTTIFTIKNNELKQQETFDPYGNLIFSPKNNIIQITDLRFGFETILFTAYNSDSGFISIHSFDNNTYGATDMYDIDYLYGIDGKGVSEEYYNSELAAITDAYDWVTFSPNTGESFEVTASNIADMKENPKKYILGYKPITIYLNNEEIEFDQEPVNMDDNLMVPIRAIAEAMGKTVLWSDEYKAAFIDNTDNALIIPVEDNNALNAYEQKAIFIADDGGYYSWERKQTNVQPMTLNGRTLVPIRQFAEALGADVEWVEEEQAAYITYDDTSSGAMDDTLYDSINLNYYIGRYTENPFTKYTANVIQAFYDSRNQAVDALAMGISSSGDVVSDWWKMLIYDETNASMIIQQTLYDVIEEIPDATEDELDISLVKDLEGYLSSGKDVYDDINGIDEAFLDAHSTLKYLNDTIKDLGKLFDFTVFTTEEIAYLLSDYSTNVGYLDALETALDNADCLTPAASKAITELRYQYTQNFYQIIKDINDKVSGKIVGTVLDAVADAVADALGDSSYGVGKTLGIGKTVWKVVFKITGVTSKGSSLETFYGIYCYNLGLDMAFNTAVVNAKMNSRSTAPDLTYIKSLIELEIATKKVAIDSIADTANFWAKDDEEAAAEQLKAELDAFTYYIWDEPSYGSGGGGGGSW